jgi:defect in organelle trafficking protein DotA
MVIRLLFLILTFMPPLAFAAEVPSFFEPAPNDISVYYLGALFGNHLVEGGTDLHLLSDIFLAFNQVVLSVGLLIIIYTIVVGGLKTAAEGKFLGEKLSGVWTPIRMALGIGLLIPQAGTGYAMSQYCVMWLVMQGIGAADTLWSATLDYFIEGGAIFSSTTGESNQYMTKETLDDAYELERYILINATCLEAHNLSDNEKVYGKYKIYQTDDNMFVNFGNPDVWDTINPGDAGRECGFITMPPLDDTLSPEQKDMVLKTYNYAFYTMALGLQDVGAHLAGPEGADDTEWGSYFPIIQYVGVNFIEYLKGAQNALFPNDPLEPTGNTKYTEKLQDLKQYGWSLAGNYYMTLSHFEEALPGITVDVPDKYIEDPSDAAGIEYEEAIKNSKDFWEIKDSSDPRRPNTFIEWPEKYDNIPNFSESTNEGSGRDYYGLTKAELAQIETYVKQLGSFGAGASTPGGLGYSPVYYMEEITSFGSATRDADPILKAAQYGYHLTATAVTMVIVMIGILFGIALAVGFIPMTPGAPISLPITITVTVGSMVLGVAAFLYAQGVMLGVMLPLIPVVIFLIGVLGWYLAVVESVVAAPLVAIGLIFPETQEQVMGRAEPAYMMILNLFMRPSLMIMGFVSAMIVTWVAVEIFNAAFYLFLVGAVQIESTFGTLVVMMVYAGVLLAIVTKVYGLINDLPNKTLLWIGDKSTQQETAREALEAARGSSERAGEAMGGAFTGAGSAVGQAAKDMKSRANKNDLENAKLAAALTEYRDENTEIDQAIRQAERRRRIEEAKKAGRYTPKRKKK